MSTGRNDAGHFSKRDSKKDKEASNKSRKNQGGSLRRRNSRKIKRRGGEDGERQKTAVSKAHRILGIVDDKAGKKGFFSFLKKPVTNTTVGLDKKNDKLSEEELQKALQTSGFY
jgi:hypothetical protein